MKSKFSKNNFFKDETVMFVFQIVGVFFISIFILAAVGLLPENLIPGELGFSNSNKEKNVVDYSKNTSISDPNSLKR
jgi:hypothetical protein